MTFPWCNFNCRHRHSRLASPNSSRVQSRPTCLTRPVNSAHHNHVPTVANIGGHLIEPVVRPLCNFDCPRLGTTTSRVCIRELCGVAFSDTWGCVGFGSGRSRCCSCGAIVLLLSPAYSLDACRPAEQTTADGLAWDCFWSNTLCCRRHDINQPNPSNHHLKRIPKHQDLGSRRRSVHRPHTPETACSSGPRQEYSCTWPNHSRGI
ncbi:hypothetical protein HDV63DRAFT_287643 [Trichoderma sp. SZMC 28014]